MRSTRKLRLEALEQRLALAGNVTAAVVDGVLTVTGDSEPNTLRLLQDVNGNVTVSRGVAATDTTTVNGASSATFAGVRSVVFDLKEGNDQLAINGPLQLTGGVSIAMGDGNDNVSSNGTVGIGGDLTIDGGAGNLSVRTLGTVSVTGDVAVVATDGNDSVVTGGSLSARSVTIQLAGGTDTVSMTQVGLVRGLRIDTGDGSSQVVLTSVTTGRELAITSGTTGDANTVTLRSVTVGRELSIGLAAASYNLTFDTVQVGRSLLVAMGDGSGTVQMSGGATSVLGHTTFVGGAGNNNLFLTNFSTVGNLLISLGGEADSLSLDNTQVGRSLVVDMGAGDDLVDVTSPSHVGGFAVFLGGWGQDLFTNRANLTACFGVLLLGFETIS